MKKAWNSKVVKGVLGAACAMMFFIGQKEICFADTTGKVIADSAKIRQSADVNSEAVGSTSAGKTVTIIGEVTDSSGNIWYEVYVDATTRGYIRSDLVSKEDQAESNATTQSPSAEGAEIPPETEMDAQYATIKVSTAKVRSGASTTKSIVDLLPENTQVIVSGQTNGSDGNIWYYITYTGTDGVEKTGYIRNDLINLGEIVPMTAPEDVPQENQATANPTSTPAENNDYQVIYEQNPEGEMEWYLYDNTGEPRTRQKLAEVLAAAHARSTNMDADAKTVSRQKIAIVVLISIIILLALAMTYLLLKLRDVYYEADEDDEREKVSGKKKDETVRKKGLSLEEELAPVKKKNISNEEKKDLVRKKNISREEQKAPVRKRTDEHEKRMPEKEVTYDEEPEVQIQTTPKRKAKNFLLENDEFEFEFLNMKDNGKRT